MLQVMEDTWQSFLVDTAVAKKTLTKTVASMGLPAEPAAQFTRHCPALRLEQVMREVTHQYRREMSSLPGRLTLRWMDHLLRVVACDLFR